MFLAVGVHGMPKISMDVYTSPSVYDPTLEMHNNLLKLIEASSNNPSADVLKKNVQSNKSLSDLTQIRI